MSFKLQNDGPSESGQDGRAAVEDFPRSKVNGARPKGRVRTALLCFASAALAAAAGMAMAFIPTATLQSAQAFLLLGALCILAFMAWRASQSALRVEQLEQALLDERSYKVFIDNAIEGFFRTTRDGHYLKVNPALAHIYGYDSPQQLMGELTDIANRLYIDPKRRAEFKALMRSRGMVQDFVSEIRRRDGSVIWIAENARTVYDGDGQFLFYEGTVEDVTVRRRSEDAMREALRESREAARAKAAFLAAMSHELKTPLNAVIGFSELMLRELFGPIGEPRYKGYIADIHDNGRKLLRTITDILDLSRIEGRLITLDDELVSMSEVVAEACESVSAATKGALSLTMHVPADLPAVRADRARVQQIIGHLLSNAIKFTPAGGKVAVRALRNDKDGLALSVADTGIGMAADRIALALEPFKQLDSRLARRFEGVGLGLPLANALLQLHGGRLTIESAPGKGTTVIASFPADRVVEAPLAVPA